MMKSVSESAQTTIMMDAQVDELVRRYGAAKERYAADGVKLSYTAAAVKAVAEALAEHPEIRTISEGEETIRTLESIDIGVAVDLGNGLMVPVLRDCDRKDLETLSADLASLVDRAKAGSLGQDDFGGAAISVSNVGMFGVRYFTPILNPPESAIVGLGTLEQEPVIRDGGIFPAWIFALSMTYDHRIIDGAPAARFLAAVKEKLNGVIPE
jgi:pyruvate dehydrogenase E2 component (dihydrolipoamide acetyltransferase)